MGELGFKISTGDERKTKSCVYMDISKPDQNKMLNVNTQFGIL